MIFRQLKDNREKVELVFRGGIPQDLAGRMQRVREVIMIADPLCDGCGNRFMWAVAGVLIVSSASVDEFIREFDQYCLKL